MRVRRETPPVRAIRRLAQHVVLAVPGLHSRVAKDLAAVVLRNAFIKVDVFALVAHGIRGPGLHVRTRSHRFALIDSEPAEAALSRDQLVALSEMVVHVLQVEAVQLLALGVAERDGVPVHAMGEDAVAAHNLPVVVREGLGHAHAVDAPEVRVDDDDEVEGLDLGVLQGVQHAEALVAEGADAAEALAVRAAAVSLYGAAVAAGVLNLRCPILSVRLLLVDMAPVGLLRGPAIQEVPEPVGRAALKRRHERNVSEVEPRRQVLELRQEVPSGFRPLG
mmetsp:Transcript_42061/g.131754  ORF Transcript_42061/g.131754 Transcript_42061/m.131754 type:complete len:278 (-) Transcript_42061:148-981(-)